MAGGKSVGLTVLAMLSLAALPEVARCLLASRALPPKVRCAAEGLFPDPTDCRYYVDCKRNSDGSLAYAIYPCPDGTFFDSCQGNCSTGQHPTECSVTCDITTRGRVTVSPNNPAVYFVCTTYASESYLVVSICPNGSAFDSIRMSCEGVAPDCPANRAPVASTCNGTYYYGDDQDCSVFYYCSGDGATPDRGQCGSDQYFITYNHSCAEFTCLSEGYFADPVDCAGFYYCSDTMAHGTCPSGAHFDSSVGRCVPGDCTTVCPARRVDFTCSSSGFFADPSDCTWYYSCDSVLQATHVECPDGSHFDSSVGGCLEGECSNTGTDFACPSSGFFADPSNCTWFYHCNSSLQTTHVKCPDGSYFYSPIGGCMTGACPSRMVDMGLEVEVKSMQFVSSLPSQHEKAHISVWRSHKETFQEPSP